MSNSSEGGKRTYQNCHVIFVFLPETFVIRLITHHFTQPQEKFDVTYQAQPFYLHLDVQIELLRCS